MKKKKIVYYKDERTDDFAGVQKKTCKIDADFKYVHKNPFWNIAAFFAYRVLMTPIAFLYCKLKFHLRIVNKKALKASKKQGAFLYGNHTLMAGDAFIPNLVSFPRCTYMIVNADNVSTKGTKNFIQMCGALPIPTERSGMKNFLAAVEQRSKEGHCIQIYPEAHIWPYYTGIRDFSSTSFRYPAKFGGAVYALTTTYQKKKIGKTPRVTVYVDGPFYADENLPQKEQEMRLRDTVYEIMCLRAKNSTYSPIEYRRAEEE